MILRKSLEISTMLFAGIKYIEHLQKEVLFIYRIFMENSFNLLQKENLILSFLKRKIKIFKNFKNSNYNSNFPLLHGLGYLKSSESTSIFKITYQLLPTDKKKYQQGWKVKKSLFSVHKTACATELIWKVMNNFAITVWLMFGKVNVPIVEPEFNAVTVTPKNRNYAEIQRLKPRKEKL